MDRTLPEVTADILTYNDAIVERAEDGSLEVFLSQKLSKTLNIPEYARLCFSYDSIRDEAVYASYDSEFFSSMARLFADKGRFSNVSLPPGSPNVEKLSRVIPEKVSFNNATFSQAKTDLINTSYLLAYFRYAALSDEKTDGLASVLINESNSSVVPFEQDINETLHGSQESASAIPSPQLASLLHSAYLASTQVILERLADFTKSLERRLNRDVKRVHEYYEMLCCETKKRIEKGASKEGEISRLSNKLNAIEAERSWKIRDLTAKYALNIQVEPLAVIRIETQSLVFWINIKRRLSSRKFPVIYNPIVRQIDPLPCESCFYPRKSYAICDDRLHIICANCFRACPHCGRQYCRACHKNKCPKCSHSSSVL